MADPYSNYIASLNPLYGPALSPNSSESMDALRRLGLLKAPGTGALGTALPLGAIGMPLAGAAYDAFTLPGDVYAGRVDPMSDEGMGRVFNMATMVTGGGMPMAEAGAVGSAGGALGTVGKKKPPLSLSKYLEELPNSLHGDAAKIYERMSQTSAAPHEALSQLKSEGMSPTIYGMGMTAADLMHSVTTNASFSAKAPSKVAKPSAPPKRDIDFDTHAKPFNWSDLYVQPIPDMTYDKAMKAQALGFNTDVPLYKGMSERMVSPEYQGMGPMERASAPKVNEFWDPSTKPRERAIFAADDPAVAAAYNNGVDGQTLRLVGRAENPYRIDWEAATGHPEYDQAHMIPLLDYVRGKGGDAVVIDNIVDSSLRGNVKQTQYAFMRPEQFRLRNAEFDSAKRDSPNLLYGGVGAAGVGGGAATMAAPDNAQAAPLQEGRSAGKGPNGAFIDYIWPHALKASEATGVDPRIIAGQAAIESGWGARFVGNNLLGIKGSGVTANTREVGPGGSYNTNASFRAYSTPADSITGTGGYADFINTNPRYGAFKSADTVEGQLRALGASGYASDPSYAGAVGQAAAAIDTAVKKRTAMASNDPYADLIKEYTSAAASAAPPQSTAPALAIDPTSRIPIAEQQRLINAATAARGGAQSPTQPSGADPYGDVIREFTTAAPAPAASPASAAPKKYKASSGAILPFSQDEDGNVRFDSNAGIVGAIKNALTLPHDVYTGEFQLPSGQPRSAPAPGEATTVTPGLLNVFGIKTAPVFDDSGEGFRRVMDLAGIGTPLNAAATMRMAAPAAAVPSSEALKSAATAGYDAVRDSGVTYASGAVSAAARGLKQQVENDGILAELAPKSFAAVNKLTNPPEGSIAPITGLEAARRYFGNAAKDYANPTEQLAAKRFQEGLEEFVKSPPPGSVISGDAGAAANLLTEARGNYAAASRSNRLTGAEEAAELRASAANSGLNVDATIRKQAASILLNPKQSAGFNDAERAALEAVARGTATRNTVRYVGNFLGGGGGLGAMVTAGMAGLAGHGGMALADSPWGLAASGLPVAFGLAARTASNAMTRNAMARADELVRARSPLYNSLTGYTAPQSQNLLLWPQTLIRGELGSQ